MGPIQWPPQAALARTPGPPIPRLPPTFPLAVGRTMGPSDSRGVAQLPAGDGGRVEVEAVVADGAPAALVQHLQPALPSRPPRPRQP